jgi:hypothetical protein
MNLDYEVLSGKYMETMFTPAFYDSSANGKIQALVCASVRLCLLG